jgi:signal transduction histidine kinase
MPQKKLNWRTHASAYLVLIFCPIVLCGLSISIAVAATWPEDGIDWDALSGRVLGVPDGGPAAQAGLRVGDRILTVDGIPPMELVNATNDKRIGEVLSLSVERAGETFTLQLVLGKAPTSILIDRLIPIAVGLGFWTIGLVTHLFSRHQPPTALLALECMAIAGMLGAGTLSTFKIPLASRLFHTFLALVSPLGLHLHLRFPRPRRGPIASFLLVLAYSLASLLGAFFLLPSWTLWRWQPWYPAVQWALSCLLGLSLVGQVILLVIAARSGQRRARRHARLLAAGAVLGMAPFLLMSLLPDLLTGRRWWPYQYTFPFLLTLPLAFGYTLVRSRLTQWDRTVARMVAVFSVSILLLSGYGLVVLRLKILPDQWMPVVLAVAGGVALWPLAQVARRLTERVLFDIRYDYTSVVSVLSERLARALDRPTLRRLLVEQLPAVMPFDGAALLLAHEDGDLYLEPPARLKVEELAALPGEGDLVQACIGQQGPVPAAVLHSRLEGAFLSPVERAWLENAAVETWLPLARASEVLGILLLGPRPGGDLLDGHDRRILESVAHQATLAAENVRLADALRASRGELARAHGQSLLAREDERRRLAWSLHDGPIQDLTAISHRLALLSDQLKGRRSELAQLRQMVIGQIRILRRLYVQLRPGTLDELGLRGAVRARAMRCEDTHGIAVTFRARGDVDNLPEVVLVTLFRVVQEALTNVERHSHATQVWLDITCDGEGVTLTVADDGQGFEVPRRLSVLAQGGHFGLLGMSERVNLLEGKLEVLAQPGEGTTIRTWLPIELQEIEQHERP